MTSWWQRWQGRKQNVSRSHIAGSLYQVQVGTLGELNLDLGSGDEADFSPGIVSISPPADHVGRPFHGRKRLVEAITKRISQSALGGTVSVLCGLGGCGKSTLAMTVASIAAEASFKVWWISANTEQSLHASMRQLAVALGAPTERIKRAWRGRDSATDLIWELLDAQTVPWLLVVDNADEPEILAGTSHEFSHGTGWIRPIRTANGHVVITTRHRNAGNWAPWCDVIELGMLPQTDGGSVLMDYAGEECGTRREAEALANRLGGLPLALRLAGAYLADSVRSPWPGRISTYSEYAEVFDRNEPEVVYPEITDDVELTEEQARRTVGRTWDLSINALEKRGFGEVRTLLGALSYLAPAAIPVELLGARRLSALPGLWKLTDARLRDSSMAMRDLGLLDMRSSREGNSRSEIVLHPLVRDVSRAAPGIVNVRNSCIASLAFMINDAISNLQDHGNPKMWPIWQDYATHAFEILDEFERLGVDMLPATEAATYGAFLCAGYLVECSEYLEAERRYRQVLKVNQTIFSGLEYPILAVRQRLASIARHLGRLSEADAETRELLAETERAYGEGSMEAISVRFDYAGVAWERRELPKAEQEYKYVLDALDRSGRPKIDMRASRSNLAQILVEMGKLDEGDLVLSTAISDAEEDPDGVSALPLMRFSRARLLSARGDYPAAISEMRNIRDECEALFGERHDRTVSVTHELGVTIQESGDPESAIPILRRALELRQRTLGSRHPDTLSSIHQLGLALSEAGNLAEARELYGAALSGRNDVLGGENENTLATRFQIAALDLIEGRHAAASREFEKILSVEIRILGKSHPSTLRTRATVAAILMRNGKFDQAIQEFEKIHSAWEGALGAGHPETQRSYGELLQMRQLVRLYRSF